MGTLRASLAPWDQQVCGGKLEKIARASHFLPKLQEMDDQPFTPWQVHQTLSVELDQVLKALSFPKKTGALLSGMAHTSKF